MTRTSDSIADIILYKDVVKSVSKVRLLLLITVSHLNKCINEPYLFFLSVALLFQHLFATEQKDQLIKQSTEFAATYTGVILRIRKEPISLEQFTNNRLGKYK